MGTSPSVPGSGCGRLPSMASDCLRKLGSWARKPLHPGETGEGNCAATRAPFLASGRNSWILGTSCRHSTCSSSGLKPGVLCDTPLQEPGEPLTSQVTREMSLVHWPSVTWPSSPGVRPGQQGPGGSAEQVFSEQGTRVPPGAQSARVAGRKLPLQGPQSF